MAKLFRTLLRLKLSKFQKISHRQKILLSMSSLLTVLVLVVCIASELQSSSGKDTLRLVHAFFRHGDRTPILTYPKDRFVTQWPQGWGQLTNAGKLRMYQLGQHFRNLYSNFIPEEYGGGDVYAYSTGLPRTLMSAQCFLAGLYPAQGESEWLQGMPWQPIPVYTKPIHLDPIYANSECTRATSEVGNMFETPEMIQLYEDNKNFLSHLEKKTGMQLPTFMHFLELYDTIKVEVENNLTIQKWIADVFPNKMTSLWNEMNEIIEYSPMVKRLRAGPSLHEVHFTFSSYIHSHKQPSLCQLFLYFAHESNIQLLAYTLQVLKPFYPPYGSSLIFELHEVEPKNYAVKIFYMNNTNQPPVLLEIPGCTTMCSFNQFADALGPYMSENWQAECDSSESMKDTTTLQMDEVLTYMSESQEAEEGSE